MTNPVTVTILAANEIKLLILTKQLDHVDRRWAF